MDYALAALPIDIDGDGDFDILAAGNNGGEISWYENNGTALFIKHIVNISASNRYRGVIAVDIDGDYDLDIAAVAYDKLVWFENLNPAGILPAKHNHISFYPNPLVNVGLLTIEKQCYVEKVTVFNRQGQLVDEYIIREVSKEINIKRNTLSSGLYFINVLSGSRYLSQKIVIE